MDFITHPCWTTDRIYAEMAMNDFNSGQFKTRMKKMATQVKLYLFLNAFLSPYMFGACYPATITSRIRFRWIAGLDSLSFDVEFNLNFRLFG